MRKQYQTFTSISRQAFAILAVVLPTVVGISQESEYPEAQLDNASAISESYFTDSDIDLADFQQPGTVRPPTATRRPTRRPVAGQETTVATAEDVGDYLASAPRMFGHYNAAAGQLMVRGQGFDGTLRQNLLSDLPIGGGASPLQITDNNSPLPQSRFFVNYNHFENAIRTQVGGRRMFSPVDQYTVGTEQTFMDGISSWQLQLPITGGFTAPGNPGVSSGQYGNL